MKKPGLPHFSRDKNIEEKYPGALLRQQEEIFLQSTG
jgi:hypothetical protein